MKILVKITDFFLREKVEKRGGSWVVISKKGKILYKTDTEEDANKRLREIEFFKNKKENNKK